MTKNEDEKPQSESPHSEASQEPVESEQPERAEPRDDLLLADVVLGAKRDKKQKAS